MAKLNSVKLAIQITIPHKEKLKSIAEKERRSLARQVEYMIDKYPFEKK